MRKGSGLLPRMLDRCRTVLLDWRDEDHRADGFGKLGKRIGEIAPTVGWHFDDAGTTWVELLRSTHGVVAAHETGAPKPTAIAKAIQ